MTWTSLFVHILYSDIIMLISFIIPTYNAVETLKRTVYSILDQQMETDYEVLLVDDGSTDKTPALAQKLAHDHPQVKYFTAGHGVSHARNIGLAHAKGTYVTFIDADDHYLAETLPQVVTKLKQTSVDLTVFSFEHGSAPVILNLKGLTHEQCLSLMLSKPTNYLTAWGKFFKRSLIEHKQIYFDEELTMAEDSDFVIRYLLACETITSSELILYHYTIDTPSATRTFDETKTARYLTALAKLKPLIAKSTEPLTTSFYKYVLIQLNIIAVRTIYPKNNPEGAHSKRLRLKRVLQDPVINEALTKIAFKDCLTPHLLPGLFLKLHCPALAIMLFKLRSQQNYNKENSIK